MFVCLNECMYSCMFICYVCVYVGEIEALQQQQQQQQHKQQQQQHKIDKLQTERTQHKLTITTLTQQHNTAQQTLLRLQAYVCAYAYVYIGVCM
jgi:cell division protein FtsB